MECKLGTFTQVLTLSVCTWLVSASSVSLWMYNRLHWQSAAWGSFLPLCLKLIWSIQRSFHPPKKVPSVSAKHQYAKSICFNPFTQCYDTSRRGGWMVVCNRLHERHEFVHFRNEKCIHFTPPAQRTVKDLMLIIDYLFKLYVLLRLTGVLITNC